MEHAEALTHLSIICKDTTLLFIRAWVYLYQFCFRIPVTYIRHVKALETPVDQTPLVAVVNLHWKVLQ